MIDSPGPNIVTSRSLWSWLIAVGCDRRLHRSADDEQDDEQRGEANRHLEEIHRSRL